MDHLELTVTDMACSGCEDRVTTAVEQVDGVHRVDANHETNSVEITATPGTEDAIRAAIYDAGFNLPA